MEGKGQGEEEGHGTSHFFVMMTGQVQQGDFPRQDNLYCRYSLTFGNDWGIVHGLDTGLSQIARKSSGADTSIVWNFPIDLTLKSTNAFGWPRIAISVFGVDHLGRDVVVGYGSMLVPTSPGRYSRNISMYTPKSSSWVQQVRSWLSGSYPEFFDSKFVSRSEGREVTRVQPTGTVKVSLDVMVRGMRQFGYNITEPASLLTPAMGTGGGKESQLGRTGTLGSTLGDTMRSSLGSTGGLGATAASLFQESIAGK
ncbi:unnamed protein product [Chrysoparadoxa australica]